MHAIICLGSLTALDAAVGGIYSVIKSKAPVTTAEYGERYTLIGPLNHQSVSLDTIVLSLFAESLMIAGCCRS